LISAASKELQLLQGMVFPLFAIAAVKIFKSPNEVKKLFYFVSALLVQLDIFTTRWNVVIGGQLFSKSFRGLTTCKMSFWAFGDCSPLLLCWFYLSSSFTYCARSYPRGTTFGLMPLRHHPAKRKENRLGTLSTIPRLLGRALLRIQDEAMFLQRQQQFALSCLFIMIFLL
jgi:hypothetical protein